MSTPPNTKPSVTKTGASTAAGATGGSGFSAAPTTKLGFNQQLLIETVKVCTHRGAFFGLAY